MTVDVDDLSPAQVVDRVLADPAVVDAGIGAGSRAVRTVPVELGDRRYEVVVGAGARHRLADTVAAVAPRAARAAVVTQVGIELDVEPGLPTTVLEVPDGEGAKSLRGGRAALPRASPVPG